MNDAPAAPFWNKIPDMLFRALGLSPAGIDGRTARNRLKEFGPNSITKALQIA